MKIDLKLTPWTLLKNKERALQLWAIGVRKARSVTQIMKVFKSYDEHLRIFGYMENSEENLSFEQEEGGIN